MEFHSSRGKYVMSSASSPKNGKSVRRGFMPQVECLEERSLLSVNIRSIDGSGNNLVHPGWGSAGVNLLRMAPNGYADGISQSGGTYRPSARVISNTVAAHSRRRRQE